MYFSDVTYLLVLNCSHRIIGYKLLMQEYSKTYYLRKYSKNLKNEINVTQQSNSPTFRPYVSTSLSETIF